MKTTRILLVVAAIVSIFLFVMSKKSESSDEFQILLLSMSMVVCGVLNVIYARQTSRSPVGWAILALISPFVSSICMAFLSVRDARVAAVNKLTDQNKLADIAKNDIDYYVRWTAVEKLTDQNVLADIAKNDDEIYVCKAAIEKLTDQNVLADIAKNAAESDVRKAAVEKLTEQKPLADKVKRTPTVDPLAYLESDDFRDAIERAKQARDQAAREKWVSQGSPGAGQTHECCLCGIETYGEETILMRQQFAIMQNKTWMAQSIEQQSAYRCKNCGKEYCKDCLEKKAPGNAYGGKSCPSCYGLFEIVHG